VLPAIARNMGSHWRRSINLLRTGDAEFRLSVVGSDGKKYRNRWHGGRTTMLSKITLALAIVVTALALAAVAASAGPNDSAQIRSSSSDSVTSSGGGGGNLVPLW
jgi:uncharacterized membrane protein